MRVGIPLLGSMFLGVVFALFLYLVLKTEGARKPEGLQKAGLTALTVLLAVEVVAGGFLVLSTMAATGIVFAFLPFICLWGLKTMDRAFLYLGALTQAWVLWRIVGVVGPNGLFDTLRTTSEASCDEMFAATDLCKPDWVAFLMFLVLLVQFFSMLLVPGLLFFAGEAHNYVRGAGAGSEGSAHSSSGDEKHDNAAAPLLH